jgi:hypothetical protein
MSGELKDALTEFARFARTLQGDEKGEAQTFLDHFFRAFGHTGAIEAGATFEFRVAKKPGSPQLELIKGQAARPKGGKKFADLLWPDRVLIEMKSRGEKLEKYPDGKCVILALENHGAAARRIRIETALKNCVLRQEPDLDSAGRRIFLKYEYKRALHGTPAELKIIFESSEGYRSTHTYRTVHGKFVFERIDPP